MIGHVLALGVLTAAAGAPQTVGQTCGPTGCTPVMAPLQPLEYVSAAEQRRFRELEAAVEAGFTLYRMAMERFNSSRTPGADRIGSPDWQARRTALAQALQAQAMLSQQVAAEITFLVEHDRGMAGGGDPSRRAALGALAIDLSSIDQSVSEALLRTH